jgi:hypothetical protein
MNSLPSVLAIALVALATAIAMGSLHVPDVLSESSVLVAAYLIVALILFSYSPVVGLAAIVLFAVVVFNRNVSHVSSIAKTVAAPAESRDMWGDRNIYRESSDMSPYSSVSSEPRDYAQFADTGKQSGWMPSFTEGFLSGAPYNSIHDDVAYGQFPIEQKRGFAAPEEKAYMYEPEESTGSDEFQRAGPQIDTKLAAIHY